MKEAGAAAEGPPNGEGGGREAGPGAGDRPGPAPGPWPTRVALGLLAAGFLFQCLFAFGPVETLVRHATVDDTFLYLQVARNWARHGVPTFDGETLTNGVQPLWGTLLGLLALVVRGSTGLIRATALLCALLNALSGLVLVRIGNLLGGRIAGMLAGGLWALLLFIPDSISGMEAPLHGLVFACLLLVTIVLARRPTAAIGTGPVLLYGALLALNAFCRLDSAIVSALVGAPVLLRLARDRRFAAAALLAGVPAVAMLAYLGVNQVWFGSPMPISGLVKFFYVHETPASAAEGSLGATVGVFLRVVASCYHWVTGYDPTTPTGVHLNFYRLTSRILGVMALAGLGLAIWKRRLPPALWAALLVLLAHAAMLAKLLERFAENDLWYYQPLRIVFALVLAFGLAQLAALVRRPVALAVLAAVGLAAFGHSALWGLSLLGDADPGHLYVKRVRMARWIGTAPELDPRARIGSWNAGQLGFFSEPRPIVNLDGLVQNRSFLDEVLRTGDWRRYFTERNIRYLVDFNAEDSTQTHALAFDPQTSFRGIVPLDQAVIVKRIGSILVLDIRPWLEGRKAVGPPPADRPPAAEGL